MIKLDAKGLFCPEPLMMVTAALKQNPQESIEIEVDTAPPRDNIVRLANKKNLPVSVVENEGIFIITIGR